MTVGQLAFILNVLPLSRASSAPTGPVVCLDVPVVPSPLWASLLAMTFDQTFALRSWANASSAKRRVSSAVDSSRPSGKAWPAQRLLKSASPLARNGINAPPARGTVSYTHLTLPTIYSV